LTLWLGSDNENDEISLAGTDLYPDIPGAIRDLRVIRGQHPGEFYLRPRFHIAGIPPNANGPDKLY